MVISMISWLQLANQNKGNIFQQSPHSQPSMHGFDGFAIKLTPDNMIERIVITEDKCTMMLAQQFEIKYGQSFLKWRME